MLLTEESSTRMLSPWNSLHVESVMAIDTEGTVIVETAIVAEMAWTADKTVIITEVLVLVPIAV